MAQDRRRAGRGLPAAAAARHSGPADPVRHQARPSRSNAERRGAEVPAGGAGQRPVHLPRHRSQDRQAAGHGRDRPRQGRAARPEDERRRRRAGRDAGRRLRQLLLARRPLLQGDPAGAAALPAQHRPGARLLHPRPPSGASVPLSTVATHHHHGDAAVAQPLPAAQLAPRSRAWHSPACRRPRRCDFCSDLAAARRCRRATRSTTAARRASTCRSPAASCVTLRLRADHRLSWRWPRCSRASAIRSSSWSRCRWRCSAR